MRRHAFMAALIVACLPGPLAWSDSDPAASISLAADGSTRISWQRRFASDLDDWINQLHALGDGMYLAVGFLNRDDNAESDWRALAVKFDISGEIVWKSEHGAGGGVDAYWAAQESGDGRIALSGFTTRIGAGGIDAYVVILDRAGRVIREGSFGGPDYDRFTDIAAVSDGGYVLAGFTDAGGALGREVLLVKVDRDGSEVWRRTIGGAGDDVALYLEPSTEGGYVLAGGASPAEDSELLIVKVDREGRELWRRVIGAPGTNDVNHGLAIHGDGRILAVGYTQSWGSRVHDMMAVTLSPDGDLLRHEIFGGADDDRIMMVRLDAAGRAWLTGYTKSAGAGGWDAFVTTLDTEGRFEGYVSTIGGPADDQGTCILPLADRGFLLGGYSSNVTGGRQDAFVLRASTPEWTRRDSRFRKQIVPVADTDQREEK